MDLWRKPASGQFYFSNAINVATATESGIQENLEDFEGHILPDQACAQNQDIGIVVLPAKSGFKRVMAKSRPDSGVSVGSDGHSDSGSADQ